MTEVCLKFRKFTEHYEIIIPNNVHKAEPHLKGALNVFRRNIIIQITISLFYD